jgi:hypothetical protein
VSHEGGVAKDPRSHPSLFCFLRVYVNIDKGLFLLKIWRKGYLILG